MAKRDPSSWSIAYAKRIARAEAKGITRQAARGHKTAEHVTRKVNRAERERAQKALAEAQRKAHHEAQLAAKRQGRGDFLTPADKKYVRSLVPGIVARNGRDAAEVRAELLDYANRVGMPHFRKHVAYVRAATKQYRSGLKNRDYASMGMSLLEYWQQDDGFPDLSFYYYH